jgi:hypothetical protein
VFRSTRIDVFADGKRSTGTLDPARGRSAERRPPPRASWAVGPAEVMGDIPSRPSRTPTVTSGSGPSARTRLTAQDDASTASASWASCGSPAPVHGKGRRYIERGLSRMGELRAIVAICERVVDPASEESR